ncbi:MAG: hypothetical protein OEM38_04090 [Gammaproteobacteria bacterium]|nr:hypothetical protein [Gammaproteobacteria bacterium]
MTQRDETQEIDASTAVAGQSEISLLCGCGRPERYAHFDADGNKIYACNKYKRCLTRDELESALRAATNKLAMYQKAVNDVDDYFEYANESKKDQKQVHKILGNLADALSSI